MARWFRVYNDILNDADVQRLPPDAFRAKFIAAIAGVNNEFSKFVVDDPQSGRLSAGEWAAVRAQVYRRDGYVCAYCGAKGGRLECDHVKPVSLGGSNDLSNLVTSCKPCNRAKRNKDVTLQEWKAIRGGKSV